MMKVMDMYEDVNDEGEEDDEDQEEEWWRRWIKIKKNMWWWCTIRYNGPVIKWLKSHHTYYTLKTNGVD